MSVSLVKITAASHVFTVGHNTAGYLPESDIAVFATLADARAYLADELDRASDALFEQELESAREDYADAGTAAQVEAVYVANVDEVHAGSTSIRASAELVKSDTDGDIAWATRLLGGSWATFEDEGNGIDTVYWIARTSLGLAFGGDTSSDEYLDVVDALIDAATR